MQIYDELTARRFIASVTTIGFLLFLAPDQVVGECSTCDVGQVMSNSSGRIPAGLLSFAPDEISCFKLEVESLFYSDTQCEELQNSTAPLICGCKSPNESKANETNVTTSTSEIEGFVTIRLGGVVGELSDIDTMAYETVLTDFFAPILGNGSEPVTSVIAKVLNQTLIVSTNENVTTQNATTRRILLKDIHRFTQENVTLSELDTVVKVRGVTSPNYTLTSANLSSDLSAIVVSNQGDLLQSLQIIGLKYFGTLSSVGTVESEVDSNNNTITAPNTTTLNSTTPNATEPAEEPSPSTENEDDGLSTGQIVGIVIGIIAGVGLIAGYYYVQVILPDPIIFSPKELHDDDSSGDGVYQKSLAKEKELPISQSENYSDHRIYAVSKSTSDVTKALPTKNVDVDDSLKTSKPKIVALRASTLHLEKSQTNADKSEVVV